MRTLCCAIFPLYTLIHRVRLIHGGKELSCWADSVCRTGGTLLPPQAYGAAAFPFQQPPQILPAVSPLTPHRHSAAPFGFPPIFYWPYPSPPVSPTSYYSAAAAAAAGAGGGPAGTAPAPAGTLVIMRGLPFTATTADILQFFQGFSEVRGLDLTPPTRSFICVCLRLLAFCPFSFICTFSAYFSILSAFFQHWPYFLKQYFV